MAIIVEKTYDFPFPPDRVYAAWVSSDTVIPPATAMDIEPKVGGHYFSLCESPLEDTMLTKEAIDAIDWPEGFYRRDIGWRALSS